VKTSLTRIAADRLHVGLALAVAALLGFGSVMVYSATITMAGHAALVQRQLLGMAIGLLPLAALWLLDYQVLKAWTGPLVVALSLLIISPRIPGLGSQVSGATSWLQVGGFRLFQPSEPAKLLFIVVLAAVIAEYEGRIEKPRDVVRVLGYVAVPFVLIMLQPDLGTGLVFIMIAMGMLLVGGLKGRWFVALALTGVVLVATVFGANEMLNHALSRGPYDPAYIAAVDKAGGDTSAASVQALRDTSVLIKQYQLNRLGVFINPNLDPKGAGYNLAQSKIAIGSGGLTGAGMAAGSQSRLNFIPERHTDFIFSVLGEQFGFVGALVLLGLYLALLAAALSISASSRDLFGALIAAGLIAMWLFQILENVGMTVGIMPITGIPLPFMSYGSSFMVTNLAGVGILLSIWSRRYGTTT
jgi:rod shape determining protein RodA